MYYLLYIYNHFYSMDSIDYEILGYEAEDHVEQYLIKHDIPYKRNVKVYKNKTQTHEIDFIIPGAIIEVKHRILKKHCIYSIKSLLKQIARLKQLYKGIIYFYNRSDEMDDYTRSTFNELGVVCIKDLDDIKYDTYSYFTSETGIIKTMSSYLNNDYDAFVHKFKDNIYTTPNTYYRCIVIMTDDEIERLTKYNIKLVDSHKKLKNPVLINSRDNSFLHSFDIFNIRIKVLGLDNEVRNPTRLISGYTEICTECKELIIAKYVKDGVCKMCKLNKRIKQ